MTIGKINQHDKLQATVLFGARHGHDAAADDDDDDDNTGINRSPLRDREDDDDTTTTIRVGFLGCGTIAEAIATGLARTQIEPSSAAASTQHPKLKKNIKISSIAVTRRSETRSTALKMKYPKLISVHDDNQEIVDKSDLVFLCVLPEQTSQVLHDLTFDSESRHTLVSLVSTAKVDDLVRNSRLHASHVSKLICLPSVARHEGIALHCCPHLVIDDEGSDDDSNANFDKDEQRSSLLPIVNTIFHNMGGIVTLKTEEELEACMVTTCIMGPLYGILKETTDWVLDHTTSLSQEQASNLVVQQYVGAIRDATRPVSLEDLIHEQTPGGLNEQALRNLDHLGGLKALRQVMEATLSRIRGQSDGSIQ